MLPAEQRRVLSPLAIATPSAGLIERFWLDERIEVAWAPSLCAGFRYHQHGDLRLLQHGLRLGAGE